jgi:hypothetical protein
MISSVSNTTGAGGMDTTLPPQEREKPVGDSKEL